MSLSTKILIWLGAIITLGLLLFIIFRQQEVADRQKSIEDHVVKQKELVDGIVRSQSEYATRSEIEKFIKDNKINLKPIQDDLDLVKADISSINVILVKSSSQRGGNLPTTSRGPKNPDPQIPLCPTGEPCPNADPFGYLKEQQNFSLFEDFGNIKLPIGSVGFSAWQKEPWSKNILGREYKVSSVIGLDENQRAYVYNKFSANVDGKDYDLPITKAETKQEYPEAKWSFWNPRLFVGVDGGVGLNPVVGDFVPSLNLGIMSYGKFKNQPDFSVLQVGVGYGTISQTFDASITPFAYNVGQHVPFMNNLYLGPSIHVDSQTNVKVMGGVRVGL